MSDEIVADDVHVGDTVTVSGRTTGNEPFQVEGVVWEPTHSPGGLWVGPVSLRAPGITITDHQPAPELGPEWEPGQPVSAMVTGERRKGFVTQRHFVYFVGDHRAEPIGYNVTPEFSDVRPLVVIDPASGSVRQRIADVLRTRFGGDQGAWLDDADAVLSTLWIEVPRA